MINFSLITYFLLAYYFNFSIINLPFGGGDETVTQTASPSTLDVEFKDDFLTEDPYRNFKQRGRLPVEVNESEMGRDNPFQAIPLIPEEVE